MINLPEMTLPEVKHPDWLKNAAVQTASTLRLIQADILPHRLRGRFIVTNILYLLRAVYGSNEAGVRALQERLLEDARFIEYCRENPMTEDELSELGETPEEGRRDG